MRLLSATSDEVTHLPSGYTYLRTGDFRLNPQHPPLVKLLCALPLLPLGPKLELSDPDWNRDPPQEWGFGFRFLHSNDADRLLFWGRMPVVLLSLLTGYFVYRWAGELFGAPAGLMALFLYAFGPNVVAHSRFVTMDLPLSCFFLLTLYSLWKHVGSGRRRHLVATGVCLGLALATKFSALILLPLVAVLLGLAAVWPGGAGRANLAARARRAAIALVVIVVLAGAVVYTVYGFPSDPLFYWRGVERVNQDHNPSYEYFLNGEFRKGGFWYYFPAAFLYKTPLVTLLLLGLSLFLWRRHRARGGLDELFLALPAVTFFVFTSAFADNLGVRYLLPVYPLIFIWVSRLADLVVEYRVGRAAAALLAGWYLFSAISIYPDHLAYFNEAVGGPKNGHRYLDDSNIDWGQDLKRLKRHMEREGIDSVRLLYGWNASADYYGIPWQQVSEAEWRTRPLPGIYAVSTHLLIRGENYARTLDARTDWLSRYQPIGRVGYSIYLFRFE